MEKKVVVIDGQGGRIGSILIDQIREQLKKDGIVCSIYAIGTNSIATSAMLKAGADFAATGENPVVSNCRDADCIVGPLGIVIADSLAGEITPKMAKAVGKSPGERVLLPISRCKNHVAGFRETSINELIADAVRLISLALRGEGC
ncbi:MAG: DUF3842 family protein [Clostridiales bacterium]|jgi:hypothetical protein|nr:DUF3842 family protein [Clostridiales bacterium]